MIRIYINEYGESVVYLNNKEYPVVFIHENEVIKKELDKYTLPFNIIISLEYKKRVKDFIEKYSSNKRYSIYFIYLTYYRVFVANIKLSTGGDDLLTIGTLINFDFDEIPLNISA